MHVLIVERVLGLLARTLVPPRDVDPLLGEMVAGRESGGGVIGECGLGG